MVGEGLKGPARLESVWGCLTYRRLGWQMKVNLGWLLALLGSSLQPVRVSTIRVLYHRVWKPENNSSHAPLCLGLWTPLTVSQ